LEVSCLMIVLSKLNWQRCILALQIN
ncbi:uncharacterized protein METZ01_LOCUS344972, partial [marine metagenome]